MTSHDTTRCTSSQESAAGPLRSDGPGLSQPNLFGPAHVHASRSHVPGEARAKPTNATSGQSCETSLASADLQSCLESKLRRKLEGLGSPEYELTWKHWDMPLGPPICALRASAHRTSGNDYFGVPHGWATPRTITGGGESGSRKRELGRTQSGGGDLQADAKLVGWPTASGRDWKDSPGMATTGVNPDGSIRTRLDQLPRVAQTVGVIATSSCAQTEKRGVLDAAFGRWLMGYPETWDMASPNHDAWKSVQRELTEKSGYTDTETP